MNKLDLLKLANDTAYETAKQNLAALDAALSSKVADLKLTDQDYQNLRASAVAFRQQYLNAYATDLAIAKRTAPAPAAAQK